MKILHLLCLWIVHLLNWNMSSLTAYNLWIWFIAVYLQPRTVFSVDKWINDEQLNQYFIRTKMLRLSQFSSVKSLSCVRLFVTQWTAAHQSSISFTNSWSLPKLMSIELVMSSNHLILCHPLLLLPSIFPSKMLCYRRPFFDVLENICTVFCNPLSW